MSPFRYFYHNPRRFYQRFSQRYWTAELLTTHRRCVCPSLYPDTNAYFEPMAHRRFAHCRPANWVSCQLDRRRSWYSLVQSWQAVWVHSVIMLARNAQLSRARCFGSYCIFRAICCLKDLPSSCFWIFGWYFYDQLAAIGTTKWHDWGVFSTLYKVYI